MSNDEVPTPQLDEITYDDVCYEDPYLKEVVARIDFVTPIEGIEKSLPAKLVKTVTKLFPISEPGEAIAQELQVSAEEVRHRHTRFKQWNFFGADREKQLAISSQFLFVTYQHYTTYEDMRSDFKTVVEAAERVFPEIGASRFGLRYINTIEVDGINPVTGWREFISPELLTATSFFRSTDHLTRLFHIFEMKYDDVDVRFQFGMPNPDYPAIMRRAYFVLDLDAYVQTAHEPHESLRYMDHAHARIQELFESSITDTLRERMHAKHRVALQP